MFDTEASSSRAAVELTVRDLPPEIADQVLQAQDQDPEFLRKVLLFGIAHKAVFETLRSAWTPAG